MPRGGDMCPGLSLIRNRHKNNADFKAEKDEKILKIRKGSIYQIALFENGKFKGLWKNRGKQEH